MTRLSAVGLTVTRLPTGGGSLRFHAGKDLIELELDLDSWKKLEESVKWHAEQVGPVGPVEKLGIMINEDHETRIKKLEERVLHLERTRPGR